MMVVDLAPGGTAVLPAPEGRSLFLYVVEGEVNIGGETVEQFLAGRPLNRDRKSVV